METNDKVEGNGNVENIPGTSSSPKSAEENPGVTYGIGIPEVASNKKGSADNNSGKSNSNKRHTD